MAKILKEGDRCRHCNTPLVKIKGRPAKKKQSYYYRFHLKCPHCKTVYMLKEEKVIIKRASLF